MFVLVDLSATRPMPQLEEPDDLHALKVVVRGRPLDRDRVAEALSSVGSLDQAGNAVLRISELVRLAGPLGDDREWRQAFDRMVDYARSRGWVAGPDGLMAHCEWTDSA